MNANGIDIGDHVHHGPTDEDWVISRVDESHFYPAGWPPCRAALADCTLIRKATAEQRQSMANACKRMPAGDERRIA